METLNLVGGPKLLLALFGDFLELRPFLVEVVNLHLDLLRRFRLPDRQQLLRDDIQFLQPGLVRLQILDEEKKYV